MEKLSTSLLLPAELSSTIQKYIDVWSESGNDHPFMTRIVRLLRQDIENINSALTAVRSNEHVASVSEADAIRDDLFIGFRDAVDAAKRRRSPEMQAGYQAVWPIIEQAGTTLYRLGYTAQSGRMDALIAELDKSENTRHLAAMNVGEIFAEMKKAQEDFNLVYQQRLDAEAKKNYPTLSESKSKAVPHVNSFLDALSILIETEPGGLPKLENGINAITQEIMVVARGRKTRKQPEPNDPLDDIMSAG